MKCEYCERDSTEGLTASANHSPICDECEQYIQDMAAQGDEA